MKLTTNIILALTLPGLIPCDSVCFDEVDSYENNVKTMNDSGASYPTKTEQKDDKLNQEDIQKRTAINFSDILMLPIEEITLDKKFEDYGADSLDLVEFVMRVEDEFNIELKDDEIKDIVNLGQLIELLKTKDLQ